MPESRNSRLARPETLTAVGIIVVAAGFLVPTYDLRAISALLPAAMLIGLIVLSVFLLLADQRKASAGEDAAPMTTSPKRVIGAFLMIVSYALACDFVGFYISTVVTIPLVAWTFGYRSPVGLLIATVIVVGTIWAIFDFGMSQDFPTGRLWGR
ncbi:tripartite tricarboxylate transporter TctB family protein [Salipiger bermudensis]|uniref:tripartite tricarboxylate transporter TctB family protein n=1 Tax=Salipiger bermudensis TaxID=344736 RepID=UPI001CD803C8|nr:tripartite tricarboxylate transporter TctB family protein [Salipiger bermudensis]MCA0964834.1 tripartite tricarboxylate transporter TctB family protein [Salipiger bermudensis]